MFALLYFYSFCVLRSIFEVFPTVEIIVESFLNLFPFNI